MLPGLVLALRDGLDGAVFVGILLGSLKRLGYAGRARPVWLGAAAAALASVLVALALTALGAELEGASEARFEGMTTLAAAAVLTWMIFWMQRQGRSVRQGLEIQVRRVVSGEADHGLFAVSFISVAREGIELALFLTAAAMATSAAQTWIGAGIGLALAAAFGWTVFASTVRLDVRRFFQVTGALLLIFAAGLVARSVHEFVEIGWLPALIQHVWNTTSTLNDRSALGQMAASLLGYRSNPSLAEVASYTGYLATILLLLWRTGQTPSRTA